MSSLQLVVHALPSVACIAEEERAIRIRIVWNVYRLTIILAPLAVVWLWILSRSFILWATDGLGRWSPAERGWVVFVCFAVEFFVIAAGYMIASEKSDAIKREGASTPERPREIT